MEESAAFVSERAHRYEEFEVHLRADRIRDEASPNETSVEQVRRKLGISQATAMLAQEGPPLSAVLGRQEDRVQHLLDA